jgi:hypothetical protein
MKIKRYSIEVTTDIIHGWKATIDEIYAPDADLFMNKETCFIGGKDNQIRIPEDAKEEEISDSLGILIVRLANALKDQAGVEDAIRFDLFKDKP